MENKQKLFGALSGDREGTKKRHFPQPDRVAIGILAVMGVCLICLGLCCGSLSRKNGELTKKVTQLDQELQEKQAQLEEAQAQIQEQAQAQAELSEAEAEQAGTEAGAADGLTSDSQSGETPVGYVGDLEQVEAGTILAEEQIDRSNLGQYFMAYEISDDLFARIYGDNCSYKTYCTVPREDLRYVKVLHYGFDGQIHVGELIVNYLLTEDMTYIFQTLFENQYQIEKMYLVEKYGADDDACCNDNNTSCFNYRLVTDGTTLSNHATGCAIDINTKNNPYFTIDEQGNYHWENTDAELYMDRDAQDAAQRHMITHDDLCYQLFAERGYTWGGDWANPKDYQHFEKVVY